MSTATKTAPHRSARPLMAVGLFLVTGTYLAFLWLPALSLGGRVLAGWEACALPMDYLVPTAALPYPGLRFPLVLALLATPVSAVALVFFLRGRWFLAVACALASLLTGASLVLEAVEPDAFGLGGLDVGFWLWLLSMALLAGFSVLGALGRSQPLVGQALAQRSRSFVDFLIWVDVSALVGALGCALGTALASRFAPNAEPFLAEVWDVAGVVGWPTLGALLGTVVGLTVGLFSRRLLRWGVLGAVFGGIAAALYVPLVQRSGKNFALLGMLAWALFGASAAVAVYLFRRVDRDIQEEDQEAGE